MTQDHHTRRAWFAWVTICLVWGTTYLAIKVALVTVPPFLLGGIRNVLASGLMLVALLLQRRPLPSRSALLTQAVLGFFMLTLGNGGVVNGEAYLNSGLTAVLVATSPFWMVGMDAVLPGSARLQWRQLLGMSIGFLGIVMLVWPDLSVGGASGRDTLLGVLSVQIACMGWAAASAYSKRHVVSIDVMGASMLQMFFGGLFMLVIGAAHGEVAKFSLTPSSAAALAYLTVLGSVVAYVAYSYALRHLPIAVVSLYTYVNPVIAVALGILLLHEPFNVRQLAAAAVIAIGMAVVRPRKAPEGDVS